MCAADNQWLVTKGVGDLDPDRLPASAGVHNQAESLIAEHPRTIGYGRLCGGRPGPDPMLRVTAPGDTRCLGGIASTEQRKRCDGDQRAIPPSHTKTFNQ